MALNSQRPCFRLIWRHPHPMFMGLRITRCSATFPPHTLAPHGSLSHGIAAVDQFQVPS